MPRPSLSHSHARIADYWLESLCRLLLGATLFSVNVKMKYCLYKSAVDRSTDWVLSTMFYGVCEIYERCGVKLLLFIVPRI